MGLQMRRVREDDGNENEDRWQRWVIERPPPQTWKSVGVLMLMVLVGLVLGIFVTGTFLLVAVVACSGSSEPRPRWCRSGSGAQPSRSSAP